MLPLSTSLRTFQTSCENQCSELTLLEKMSNSQKFDLLLTLTSWMMMLYKREQKQQLATQIKQFFDVLFCTYISNMEKISFL